MDLDDRQLEITITVAKPHDRLRRKSPRPPEPEMPRIPRISRLMALAIKFQVMVDRGEVRDYADLARLGYVTRARLTQVMNLNLLAPDIQDTILHLAGSTGTTVNEHSVRLVASFVQWSDQRKCWAKSFTTQRDYYARPATPVVGRDDKH